MGKGNFLSYTEKEGERITLPLTVEQQRQKRKKKNNIAKKRKLKEEEKSALYVRITI